MIKNTLVTLLCAVICVFVGLSACVPKKEREWKDSYTISLGEDVFQVPTDYLVDADNRKDGSQRYVVIMAKNHDLEPFDETRQYVNPPNRIKQSLNFSLNYGDGKNLKLHPDSLLYDWAKQGHYSVPETWEKEGLVHLGINKLAGRRNQNVYAYVRDEKPIAQLLCGTSEDWERPGCIIYQGYREGMDILVTFDIEDLDWYAEEGLDKILKKVEGWRVKPAGEKP
jgi:hypothetical protein